MKKILLCILVACATIITTVTITAATNHSEVCVSQKTCRITQECLAATTEDNFKVLNQVCNRKDETALKQMITAGQVCVLSPKYSISMVDYGFGKCKIYVADLGINVWVSTDYIEYK